MSFLALRRRIGPPDALDSLAAAPAGDRFYLEPPESGQARVGAGAVARIEASGPTRFRDAATHAAAMLGRVEVVGDPGPPASGPLLLGGFAFADEDTGAAGAWRGFAPAAFVLPELLLVRDGDDAWLTAIAPDEGPRGARLDAREARLEVLEARLARWRDAARHPEPPAAPAARALEHRATPDAAPAAFVARVESALRDIARGELEKVVLARSLTLVREGGYDPIALLRDLRGHLPSCAAFLVERDDAAFLGASPERLLRRCGERVETAAVAGTAPRGRSPERDRALADALLESKKEQAEHAVVLRFLKERLARHAAEIDAPESPDLLRLEGMQHLRTPVAARLERPLGALELAGELHPTPATAGAPDAAARAWLEAHEGLERGWYGGPLGWCDATGNGELWVALRSGLLRGDTLRIFAGAGVVDGSDPHAELRETRLKLGTLLQRALEL